MFEARCGAWRPFGLGLKTAGLPHLAIRRARHAHYLKSGMDRVSAAYAKQSFRNVLERAALSPVGIEKNGKLIAAMVPPEWLARGHPLDGRRRAREDQQRVELNRLIAHQ